MNLTHRNRILGARKVVREAEKTYSRAISGVIAEGVPQKEVSALLGVSQSKLSRQFGKRRKEKK